MKPARKGSLQREAQGAFFNTLQELRRAGMPEKVILAAMVNVCAMHADQVEILKGVPVFEWLRMTAGKFSAVADEMEKAFHTAVPFVDTLKRPAKRQRKTTSKTKATR